MVLEVASRPTSCSSVWVLSRSDLVPDVVVNSVSAGMVDVMETVVVIVLQNLVTEVTQQPS